MSAEQAEGSRQRRSRAEVEQLVTEYESSGLTQQEFCKRHGLSLSTLLRHRKRSQLRMESAAAGGFIPVKISLPEQGGESHWGSALVVWLLSGRKIEVRGGFDVKAFEQLVRVLEQA